MTTIEQFKGKHAFLSNFWQGEPLRLNDFDFPTAEHAFQAAKANDPDEAEAIAAADTPGKAKRLGRKVILRPNWEAWKLPTMRTVLAVKFTLDREEGQLLLATGDALLVEGNTWGDTFWGADRRRPHMPGQNWLGHLLMARRAELRAEKGTA